MDSTADVSRPRRLSRKESRKPTPAPVIPAFIAILVVSMVIAVVLRGRGTKGTCHYDSVYRKASCHTKHLLAIPGDISDSVIALHMGSKLDKADNQFTAIRRSNFSRFGYLKELKLVKCGIEEIEPETFADLEYLRRLDLRYNRIQFLCQATFKGLTHLEYLYLSNNPIRELGENLFQNIRLDQLILANNPTLGSISRHAFAGAKISSLVLDRCNVGVLEPDIFPHLSDSLQELYITNNLRPLEIAPDAFQGLNLQMLSLENNGLTTLNFLTHVFAIDINLDDNPFGEADSLGKLDSPHLSRVKRLSLSNTGITNLARNHVAQFSQLEELDLEGNGLAVFNSSAFSLLKELRTLDLSRNGIEYFAGSFDDAMFGKLEALYLDENKIQKLPRELERLFTKIKNLTLAGNPLHCNCELRWFTKWLDGAQHRLAVQDLHSVACQSPETLNITQVTERDLKCEAPTILNATFDADGISLVCTAEGDPAPTVTWVTPDENPRRALEPTCHIKSLVQTSCSLPITKDGNYTCVASNVEGTDRVVVDTKTIPTSGLRFSIRSQKIDILESPQGFFVTLVLLAVLGYMLRHS